MPHDEIEINETTLQEMLRGLDKPTLLELIEFYINETRERIPRMRPLLESGDLAELKREAHSLKGASRTYGASGYGEIAFLLETACKDEDAATANELLLEIETRMNSALDNLDAYVRGMPEA